MCRAVGNLEVRHLDIFAVERIALFYADLSKVVIIIDRNPVGNRRFHFFRRSGNIVRCVFGIQIPRASRKRSAPFFRHIVISKGDLSRRWIRFRRRCKHARYSALTVRRAKGHVHRAVLHIFFCDIKDTRRPDVAQDGKFLGSARRLRARAHRFHLHAQVKRHPAV
ncbi:MAG: hypothetical protein DELT_03079 [Desulfovibrio sp.]